MDHHRSRPTRVFIVVGMLYVGFSQIALNDSQILLKLTVLLPISPYASTKVSGELLGHVYSHLFGIRFVGLRFFTVYGPRQRPDLAIHKFATLMLSGQPIPLFGNGDTSRDYTYVSDITQGIRAAMTYVATPYELFNLGGSSPVTLLHLIHSLAGVLNIKPKLETLPPQPGDVPQTWASIEKAQRQLGYRPETTFSEGLTSFVNWLCDSDLERRVGRHHRAACHIG